MFHTQEMTHADILNTNAAHCVFAQVTMLNSDVVSSVFRLGDEMTASEIKPQRVLGLGIPNTELLCHLPCVVRP